MEALFGLKPDQAKQALCLDYMGGRPVAFKIDIDGNPFYVLTFTRYATARWPANIGQPNDRVFLIRQDRGFWTPAEMIEITSGSIRQRFFYLEADRGEFTVTSREVHATMVHTSINPVCRRWNFEPVPYVEALVPILEEALNTELQPLGERNPLRFYALNEIQSSREIPIETAIRLAGVV